jgi:outer membrane immunogenic protein
MKKLLAGAALAAFALAGPAFAADMPVKTPPPVVTSSWTGFYVGVEAGAQWSRDRWTTTCLGLVGVVCAGGAPVVPVVFPVDTSSPRNFNFTGARAGVYWGYNWQVAPAWVMGVEMSATWADGQKTTAGVPGCSVAPTFCGFRTGGTISASADASWVKALGDAGLRARLGYLATPDTLLYVTGGLAAQRLEVGALCLGVAPGPWCIRQRSEGERDVLIGWTAGAGLEWNLNRNWRLRGEYRYAEYDRDKKSLFLNTADDIFASNRLRTHVATFGIAHAFGAPEVVAKY